MDPKRNQHYQSSHHHAGMTVHPGFNNYIPTSKPITTIVDRSSSYVHHTPFSTDKQQQHKQEDHDTITQPRKRTRATPEQLSVLEKTFSVNPSPNNRVREQLSRELGMSERSIQIWFQNRRAKVKNMAKRSSLLHDETMRMQYYAATAAAAACQSANQHQQHTSPDGTPIASSDLYYYYYYYYYNQQQQKQQQQQAFYGSSSILTLGSSKTSSQSTPPPPPPPPPMPSTTQVKSWSSLSTPPPSSIHPSTSTPISLNQHTSSVSAIISDTAGGRVRSHSVGHYPYNPYQRPPTSRPGSTEPLIGYYHRRHHSSSASPAPQATPPPINMWSSSSSTMMLGGVIPEEDPNSQEVSLGQLDSSTSANYDSTAAAAAGTTATWSSGLVPMSMSLVQDERLGTPMSMDEFTTIVDDDRSNNYHRISVETLQIGTWKRMSLQPQDLECFYDSFLRCMVWRIQDGQQRFKMHITLDSIERIQLDPLLERLGWARLTITVHQPETISFYMEDGEQWTQCRDFTQDKQATSIYTHSIDGPALALRAEWMRLVAQDQHLQDLFCNNMVQQQQYYGQQQQQQVMHSGQSYQTARGPHGQSMLSNSTPSREVTPADVMMALQQQDNQQMLSLNQDSDEDAQALLLFQGV
ncbi:hypothetical protein BC941DRAFT_516134 [Chlamydoabsidia padenii]|nr:hypothetical protein BC941DRAFT_516134 [Chlamydoabsidia padenii]